MPDESRDLASLWDMREAGNTVVEFMREGDYARLLEDRMFRSAVERQLSILGEAANRISPEFRAAHTDIPWRDVVGLRNVLVHEYDAVRYERIWDVVTIHLPRLLVILDELVPPIEGE